MAANVRRAKANEDKSRRGRMPALPDSWWAWFVVLAILASVCLVHVHARLEVVRMGYSLSKEASSNRKLLAQRRKLALEVATLKSPRRLRRLALDELGMVEPGASRTLKVRIDAHGKLALNN